jgi:hypothetical protein
MKLRALANRRRSCRWRTSTSPNLRNRDGDSWRSASREFARVDHEPSRRSLKTRQADCDSGAGHLLAIIKPKIVRHTIILSTNNLFLLMPPTSLYGRLANPAVINLSIRSSRSPPSTFRVIFLLWRRARSMHSLMILQHDR